MPTDPTQWITLLLIALLFGKDNLLPAILKKMGLTNGNGNKLENKMDALTAHYNHDTTSLLTEIRDEIRELKDSTSDVKELKETQCKKLDILLMKQEEILKYGVPTRPHTV